MNIKQLKDENKVDRYRKLIRNLKVKLNLTSQKDVGSYFGYAESSFSQVINGIVPDTEFIKKLCKEFSNFNVRWLISGEGEMFTDESDSPPPTIHSAGDVAMYNSQIHHDNLAATLQRLTDEIAEQRRTYTELLAAKDAQIAQKDAQISQLLNLLSK